MGLYYKYSNSCARSVRGVWKQKKKVKIFHFLSLRLTLSAFGLKLNDYWKALIEKQSREREFQTVDQNESAEEQVDDEWVFLCFCFIPGSSHILSM